MKLPFELQVKLYSNAFYAIFFTLDCFTSKLSENVSAEPPMVKNKNNKEIDSLCSVKDLPRLKIEELEIG